MALASPHELMETPKNKSRVNPEQQQTQKEFNKDLPFDTIGVFPKSSVTIQTELTGREMDETRRAESHERRKQLEQVHGLISQVQKTKRQLEARSAQIDVREQKLAAREREIECKEVLNSIILRIERDEIETRVRKDLEVELMEREVAFQRTLELER